MTAEAWIPVDTFGTRLVMIRREKGLTVEQAAKQAGIAHPTWSTWERGARPRDMAKAVSRIAAAFGVNRDWLMWGGPLTTAGEENGGPMNPRYVGENPAVTVVAA